MSTHDQQAYTPFESRVAAQHVRSSLGAILRCSEGICAHDAFADCMRVIHREATLLSGAVRLLHHGGPDDSHPFVPPVAPDPTPAETPLRCEQHPVHTQSECPHLYDGCDCDAADQIIGEQGEADDDWPISKARVRAEQLAAHSSELMSRDPATAGMLIGGAGDIDLLCDALSRLRSKITREALENVVRRVITRVCELPDRTSPDDWPEAMIVTDSEMHNILTDEFAEHFGGEK